MYPEMKETVHSLIICEGWQLSWICSVKDFEIACWLFEYSSTGVIRWKVFKARYTLCFKRTLITYYNVKKLHIDSYRCLDLFSFARFNNSSKLLTLLYDFYIALQSRFVQVVCGIIVEVVFNHLHIILDLLGVLMT